MKVRFMKMMWLRNKYNVKGYAHLAHSVIYLYLVNFSKEVELA